MKKSKYCQGCGIKLQNENILNMGFTTNLDNPLCMRCFRLINYGEYESVSASLVEYEKILSEVNRKRDLVLYIVDILNMPRDLMEIRNYLKNDIILVLNKRDLLPLSIKDEKILNYLDNLGLDFVDKIIISSEKNYNMDLLYNKIRKHQRSNNVYVVGFTNAGKSSVITKFIKNYSENDNELTVSPLPSTTLSKIMIPIDSKVTLIDTPGIVDNSNIINYVDKKMYKKLNSKKEIKPRTYQLMKNQSLIIGELARIDYLDGDRNSLTLYLPNEIKVKRVNIKNSKLKDLCVNNVDMNYYEDLVINGLGFIKMVAECKVNLYLDKNILYYKRKNLI